jgi:hypothetical protein
MSITHAPVPLLTLADTSNALTGSLWLMLAIVLAIGGLYVIRAVKRWSRKDEAPEIFTLQDLRDMHARNEITEQEYATLRAELLGRARAADSSTVSKEINKTTPPASDHP